MTRRASSIRKTLFINDLIIWIDLNLDKDISLKLISNKSGYSLSYIQQLFKKETGCTLFSYIRLRRLFKTAKALRCDKGQKTSELARNHGFGCLRHFNRIFIKHYGIRPHHYRYTFDYQQYDSSFLNSIPSERILKYVISS
ncbi:helix-turn-helix transcriptional regulator [Enterobacter kobei]|uniref:helix-turn-helix transcriptional regulator n=1 Tax=Enterobacter kobei TaxID=208224 RepID=UPI0037C17A2B